MLPEDQCSGLQARRSHLDGAPTCSRLWMSFKHWRFLLSDHLKPTTSRRSIRQNNNCCLQAKSLCKKVRCARSHADAHTRRRRDPRAVSLSCVPGASSAISTAINCCRATICRRALTEASGLGTKSCFAPPGRRLSTGGWTVRSKQVTHLHGQSTNTKIAPQVPQPQEVKCTTWEPRQSSSRVLPEQHRRRKGNTAEAG